MAGLDHIKAKFWKVAEARGLRIGELLAESAAGKGQAREQLKALIHSIKGEAQLLSLEPCATMLERTDRLAKIVATAEMPRSAALAFEAVAATLVELGRNGGTSESTESTLRTVEDALRALGDGRTA